MTLLATAFVLIAASKIAPALPKRVPFPADAAIALVAHELRDSASHVSCLSVDGKDPSGELMAAVKSTLATVEPRSACSAKPNHRLVHTLSGKSASHVQLANFTNLSATTASATYSVYFGPLMGHQSTARFRLESGRWIVVAVKSYGAF